MANDDDVRRNLAWFRHLPMDDQVALLSDPAQPLSDVVENRLAKLPGIWWWQRVPDDPVKAMLTGAAINRVEEVKAQLDYWWSQIEADHEYIIENRDGELDGAYADKVRAVNETELGDPPPMRFIVVKDNNNHNRFRLPSMIRAYVELRRLADRTE
jgi:hypothetical protein